MSQPRSRARALSVVTLGLLVGSSCGGSDATSQRRATPDSLSNAEARTIINEVVTAAGGQENINAIRTLAVQYVHTRFPAGADSGPDAPTPQVVDVLQVRDFNNGRHLYEVYASADPETWERVVILPNSAFSVNLLTNQTTRLASDALAGARYGGLQLRWYVYAALSEASTAGQNLRHPSDTTLEGHPYHILTYPGIDTETIELWIDGETKVIVRREIRASDPILGNAVARLEFRDYQDVGGIPMPMEIAIYTGSRLFEHFDMQEVRINAEIQESAFTPPAQ